MLRSSAVLTAVLFGIFLAVVPRPAFAQADKYSAAGATNIIFGPFITGTTTATLLAQDIQNSSTADLVLQVTMECGIVIVDPFTPGSRFGAASVNVWVEIDGVRVPVTSLADGTPTDPPPVGEVIFCDRSDFRFTFEPEFDIDQIVHANAFNWVKLNVGAGKHTVKVMARLTSSTFLSTAQALVRRRTLIIEPAHMVKSQDVQPFTP